MGSSASGVCRAKNSSANRSKRALRLSAAAGYEKLEGRQYLSAVNYNLPPVQLTGNIIGTVGSYGNQGNTSAKAFDGGLASYFDAPTANGNWIGLDLGAPAAITSISYAPRFKFEARMIGGVFQGSTSADFSTGVVNLFTVGTVPVAAKFTSVTPTATGEFQFVRYVAPAGSWGSVADIQFKGISATPPQAIAGTTIGSAGSYNNNGKTIANAVDGNLLTYFDGASANGSWVGIDAGTPRSVTQIGFAPRSGFTTRMAGGKFQASSTPDFSSSVVDLYTIGTSVPAAGAMTYIGVNPGATYEYFRYLSPALSYGDVAEVQFAGPPPATSAATPSVLTATAYSYKQIYLNWTNTANNASSFTIQRSTDGINFGTLANVSSSVTAIWDPGATQPGATYYYTVVTNTAGGSAVSTVVSAQAVLPAFTDYSTPSANPAVSGVDVFSPPTLPQGLAGGVPAIAANSLDGGPDNTLTFTGRDFTANGAKNADTRFIVYGQTTAANGMVSDALLQDETANSVLATIPGAEVNNSMYLVWPVNSNGVGAPVAINQTKVNWMSPTTADSTSTVSVYGRNLSNGALDPQSKVWLQSNSTGAGFWAQTRAVNNYQVQFGLPNGLNAGTYQVWVYNGHGGQYGWSRNSVDLTVVSPPTAALGNTIDVTAAPYNAPTDGTTDAGPAILKAISALQPNDTLYFPAGTYFVDTNAEQNLTMSATGGTFTLSFKGATTGPLAYNSTARQMATALNALSTMGPGGVAVYPFAANQYAIVPAFAHSDSFAVDATALTGSGAGASIFGTQQLTLPSDINVIGAGANTSTIKFASSIPSGGSGQYAIGFADGSARNVDIENIGLVYDSMSSAYWKSPLIRERESSNLRFDHVNIVSNYVTAFDWEEDTGISLTNSTVQAGQMYINDVTDLNIDSNLLLQSGDEYGIVGIYCIDTTKVRVSNNTVENLYDYLVAQDPSHPYNKNEFGDGKFLTLDGRSADAYVAGNTTVNFGVSGETQQTNSGENIGGEGAYDIVNTTVYSATSNSFTIAGNYLAATFGSAIFTTGGGLGQLLQLSNSTATYDAPSGTTKFTFPQNFKVAPVIGDQVEIQNAPSNLVIYNNSLNHTTGQFSQVDTSSIGISFWTGVSGLVVDHNTVNNTRVGVQLVHYKNHVPMYFNEVINNNFNGMMDNGINFDHSASSVDVESVGTVVRANAFTGGVQSQVGLNVARGTVGGYSLTLEHNTITGFATGARVAVDPHTLLYANTFAAGFNASAATSTGIGFRANPLAPLVTPGALLHGNSYSGFNTNYSSTASSFGAAPTTTVYITTTGSSAASQTVTLWNDGPSVLNWSGSLNISSWPIWLNTTSGSINAEGSTSLTITANPVGLTPNFYYFSLNILLGGTQARSVAIFWLVQS